MIIFMCLFFTVALIATTLGIFFSGLYLVARINEAAEQEKFAFFRYAILFVLIFMFTGMYYVLSVAEKFI